jgi:hypothetical protein
MVQTETARVQAELAATEFEGFDDDETVKVRRYSLLLSPSPITSLSLSLHLSPFLPPFLPPSTPLSSPASLSPPPDTLLSFSSRHLSGRMCRW